VERRKGETVPGVFDDPVQALASRSSTTLDSVREILEHWLRATAETKC